MKFNLIPEIFLSSFDFSAHVVPVGKHEIAAPMVPSNQQESSVAPTYTGVGLIGTAACGSGISASPRTQGKKLYYLLSPKECLAIFLEIKIIC